MERKMLRKPTQTLTMDEEDVFSDTYFVNAVFPRSITNLESIPWYFSQHI